MLGVRVETLRRWEREGRLTTARTPGGQRRVPAAEVARLPGRKGRERPKVTSASVRNRSPGSSPRSSATSSPRPSRSSPGPHRILAFVTREAVDEMGLKPGHARRRDGEGDQRHGRGGPSEELPIARVSSAAPRAACCDGLRRRSGGRSEAPERQLTVAAAASLTCRVHRHRGRRSRKRTRGRSVSLQLRSLRRARHPDRRGRAGRRLRVGEPDLDGPRAGRGPRRDRPDRLRPEQARDHRPGRQPGGDREPRRPSGRRRATRPRRRRRARPATTRGEILDNAGIAEAALANVVSNEEDVKRRHHEGARRATPTPASSTSPTSRRTSRTRSRSIQIPDDVNVIATYPIAVVTGSQEADLAQRSSTTSSATGSEPSPSTGSSPPP